MIGRSARTSCSAGPRDRGAAHAELLAGRGYHQDFFEKNPTQGYCLAVAAPKVAKFRKTFVDLTRK
jgi:hypothetical protein